MKNRRCFVTFATLHNYSNSVARLKEKLIGNIDDDVLIFNEYDQIGSPPFDENPYAFKIYAFEKAKSMGYNIVLWFDCSCYPIKNIDPIFEVIEQDGYICQQAGQLAGIWTNDATLSYFGLTRDEAMQIDMYGNAGLLGLNFNNEIANTFFELWKKSMLDGMFRGKGNNDTNSESADNRCRGHRHDMSCGSIIRHKLNMKMVSSQEYLQYVSSPNDIPFNEKIYLFAQGIN